MKDNKNKNKKIINQKQANKQNKTKQKIKQNDK